jgi:hypothetical protein
MLADAGKRAADLGLTAALSVPDAPFDAPHRRPS